MAFQLERSERIPADVRRVVRERLDKVIEALGDGTASSDANIHAARKHLKEVRATLRLVRKELGGSVFERENVAVRDAARPLSNVRDAKVLIERLDELNERFKGRLLAEGVANLRDQLVARRRSARADAIKGTETVSSTVRRSRAVRRRVKTWPLRRSGWKAVEAGLRSVYKRGREAMCSVRSDPTVGALHEWRKRAKDLRYELQLLRRVCPAATARLADRVHELADLLGEDHDLAILRSVATAAPTSRVCIDAHALIELVDERRCSLQKRAVALGASVYDEKARAFARRFKHQWKKARRK